MHIKTIQFAWPPAKLLTAAKDIFEPMSHQIITLKRKNANLRRTRDLLLPDCGWVHETGDVAGLAAAIDELFAAPAEAEARGQRGRQRILSQYTWAAVEAELCEVYQRLGLPVADPSLKPL